MLLQFLSILALTIFIGLIIEYMFAYFRPREKCDHEHVNIKAWSHHEKHETSSNDDLLE